MTRRFEGMLGVFDSGVGGLTVVDAVLRHNPDERVLYVADQAHVPYGGRPLDQVQGFATGISVFLAEQGCRSIVMACNISSAVALPSVQRLLAPLPVAGVIIPACLKAVQVDAAMQPGVSTPVIGVLATEGTVNSGAYPLSLGVCNPHVAVAQVPCPRFVPLVEAGQTDCPDALDAAREYLTILVRLQCRTIILGCTHYPYLLPALRQAVNELFSDPVTFVDPAHEAVSSLSKPAANTVSASSRSLLLSTGNTDNFECQIHRLLPKVNYDVGAARWEDGKLTLIS